MQPPIERFYLAILTKKVHHLRGNSGFGLVIHTTNASGKKKAHLTSGVPFLLYIAVFLSNLCIYYIFLNNPRKTNRNVVFFVVFVYVFDYSLGLFKSGIDIRKPNAFGICSTILCNVAVVIGADDVIGVFFHNRGF